MFKTAFPFTGLILLLLLVNVVSGQSYRSRSSFRPTSYRQTSNRVSNRVSPNADRIEGGDVLAIIVDGVLGDFSDPPVHKPAKGDKYGVPALGYPVVVRNDGTVDLPEVRPISLRGLTVRQAKQKITNAYHREKILKANRKNQVMVSMLRKRMLSVTVIHDNPADLGYYGQQSAFAYEKPTKKISKVTLPADQATTLNAIAEAGAPIDSETVLRYLRRGRGGGRVRDNAVVDVPGQSQDFFYAGGLLPGGRFPIPEGGLSVMQAIALSGGSVGQVGLGPSDLYLVRNARSNSGARPGVFKVDMRNYRNNPAALNVQPGDVLILRNKPGEVLGKAAVGALNANINIGL